MNRTKDVHERKHMEKTGFDLLVLLSWTGIVQIFLAIYSVLIKSFGGKNVKYYWC